MNRRSSISSLSSASSASSATSATSSLAKRPVAMDNATMFQVDAAEQTKKRVALGNISNQNNVARQVGDNVANANVKTSSSMKEKGTFTSIHDPISHLRSSVNSAAKTDTTLSSNESLSPANNLSKHAVADFLGPSSAPKAPSFSDSSISSMSASDSMNSPEFEYIDNGDSVVLATLERRTNENLHISEHVAVAESKSFPMVMEVDEVIDVDTNHNDPQFCTTLACDIYKYLRIAETKKRPATDYMETIQKDINASMRSTLIDWLVEVAEEYHLVPDTLYLTVNYIDRYLSGNEMNRQRLQLLGVACMLIAAKYEEICAPQVEEFCYITDNTYLKDEVLQMEADVLKYLKFEMTTPTAKCFLRRFIQAARGFDQVTILQLEFLASYIAELSLLEYNMLCYAPSLIAASATFLAKFILQPTKRPWNATLCHYTLYRPSDLSDCVTQLHRLFCTSAGNNLPAIREKYSQHKNKFVGEKYCSAAIPTCFFQDVVN